MVAERLDTQPSADGPTPKQARFAAEASIRAALRPNSKGNNRGGESKPEAETRKSKKKKRNRKRGRERNFILADASELPIRLNRVSERPVAESLPQDEGALDLGTVHEGEIDMRDGAVHVIAQPRHEKTTPVQAPQIEMPQFDKAEQDKEPVIVPAYETPDRHDHNAPPVPPGFQEFSQVLMGQELPEQYKPPVLEATPLHKYPTEETSRTTVTPISVEARRPAEQLKQAIDKSEMAVGEISRGELLKIAKTINIDGVKLKDIFDAKRIDEEGLRAVVETYLRGGDVKRQLTEEVMTKEQSFERDPSLRHQRQRTGGKLSTTAISAATIATAGARRFIEGHAPQLAASSKKTAKKAKRILANGARHAHQDIIDNSNTSDWLSITAIVIVWSLIVFLIFG